MRMNEPSTDLFGTPNFTFPKNENFFLYFCILHTVFILDMISIDQTQDLSSHKKNVFLNF